MPVRVRGTAVAVGVGLGAGVWVGVGLAVGAGDAVGEAGVVWVAVAVGADGPASRAAGGGSVCRQPVMVRKRRRGRRAAVSFFC